MSNTFHKEERLCSRRQIERLFAEGHSLRVYPFTIRWMEVESDVPCQVLIVAPKRMLHHAVARNRAKRLIRECYRTRKENLYLTLREQERAIVFCLVYTHREVLPFDQMGRRMDKVIAALTEAINNQESNTDAE